MLRRGLILIAAALLGLAASAAAEVFQYRDAEGRVYLTDRPMQGDVVLVKGSKGSRVSKVVDAIRKLGHPQPSTAEGAE